MRQICVGIGLLFLWFDLHTLWCLADGLFDDDGVSDVAVVLGNRVELDGRPGPTLRVRLDAAATLWRQGRARAVLVSGGLGVEGFEEADVMRDDLLAHGVPDDAIVVDRTGYDTWKTALATKALAREHGWQSATIVTSYFHIARAKLALRRAGIPVVRGVRGRVRFDLRDAYSIGREFPAYYSYLWRTRAHG